MCGLVILWITLLGSLAVAPTGLQAKCDGNGACQGQRPRSREGCCPLLPGDACGSSEERECDQELGFACTDGLCIGAYNLTVTSVGTTEASLSWRAHLQEGSRFEYSVLYTRTLTLPLTKWSSHGVGDTSKMTLMYLTPATLYYVRVGVWMDRKYENLTEVLFFNTKPETHCVYNGRHIAIGESLVVECEESCDCLPTGRFECVPVCRKSDIETPVCTDGQAKDCCDAIPHCLFSNCTYLGDSVAHAQTWTIDCQENCTCYDGFVTCSPLCEESSGIPDCGGAVVVKSEDECCDTWRCDNPEDTCDFRNATFKEGTWFYDDCELCTCDSSTGNVNCIDFSKCDTPEIPETSEACRNPTIINNLCCSQVFCEQNQNLDDLLEVFSVTSYHTTVIIVRFKLTSATKIDDVNNVVLTFSKYANQNTFPRWENITFSLIDIEDISYENRDLVEFEHTTAVYKTFDNYIVILSGLEPSKFYYFKLQMEISTASETSENRTTQMLTTNLVVLKVHGDPVKNPDRIQNIAKPRNRFFMEAVNISSLSVAVMWHVPEAQKNNISWFVIRYKPLSASTWLSTERLIFSESTHALSCLYESRWYQAELWAYPGERKLIDTFFNTSGIIESPDAIFAAKIKRVELGTSYVKISWEPFQKIFIDNVTMLEILWSKNDDDAFVYKICVPPGTSEYSIDSLVPGQMYKCRIRVNLHSGKAVFSSPVHFVTSASVVGSSHSSTSHRHSIILAVTVSVVSVISIVIAIATVTYLFRCRRRSSYLSQTSFENKIFQIYKEDRDV